jgi:hypothetical protein
MHSAASAPCILAQGLPRLQAFLALPVPITHPPSRLIPIRQTEWPAVHDSLLPGTEVVVRVHKLNDFPKYRWGGVVVW